MIYKLFLFILLFTVTKTYGQYENWTEAKIYLTDGQVLEGRVILPYVQNSSPFGAKEKVRFKTDPKKVSKKISASDIDSMLLKIDYSEKVNGKRIKKQRHAKFITISKNERNSKFGFAELLVDGKLKLVKRIVAVNNGIELGSLVEFLFVKNKEMAVVFSGIKLKSFKKRAVDYFDDCLGLVAMIENEKWGRKDLDKIIAFYNSNCGN